MVTLSVSLRCWQLAPRRRLPKRCVSERHCLFSALTHTQEGFTALMYAAQKGHTNCLKALLEAGEDKEAKSNVRWYVWTCDARLTQLTGRAHTAQACCHLWPCALRFRAAGSLRPEGDCH